LTSGNAAKVTKCGCRTRPLADIDAEILQLEEAIRKGIGGILS